MTIEKYTSQYQNLTAVFKCGNNVIDNFLKGAGALEENQGITYLLLSNNKDCIIGFYNIEVGRVDQTETICNQTIYKPMGGSVNINYLAIDKRYQRMKIAETQGKNIYLGDYILRDCEKRILELRKQVGITFVTLYSTEQGYHLYHVRNGYENFDDDMSTFVPESDTGCRRLYKCVDDVVGA